ncbi:hypothetical protein ABFX02_14G312800 [Erythranthe guttata]
MVRKKTRLAGSDKPVNSDVYNDIKSHMARSRECCNEMLEYRRRVEEDDNSNVDYKNFLLRILPKEGPIESRKKRREKYDDVFQDDDIDCSSEEDIDPQIKLFFTCLKEHEKSYVLECNDVVIKYEGDDSSSFEECEPYPRRKLRSATKQKVGPTDVDNQLKDDSIKNLNCGKSRRKEEAKIETVENVKFSTKRKVGPTDVDNQLVDDSIKNLNCGKLRRKEAKSETVENVKFSTKQKVGPTDVGNQFMDDSIKNLNCGKSRRKEEARSETVENVKFSTNGIVPDPHYIDFFNNLKVVNDHCAYTRGRHTVVYEWNDGKKKNSSKKEEQDEECSSDVEIIDCTLFDKEVNKDSNLGDPSTRCEFRKQVIDVLRKPYDREEYTELLMDIRQRKQEGRHRELRHGREGPCSVNKDGKSYLDHHPDLREVFLRFVDDKPKCLNLFRGFFFWLQNFLQHEAFKPWLDEECLAIRPGSC